MPSEPSAEERKRRAAGFALLDDLVPCLDRCRIAPCQCAEAILKLERDTANRIWEAACKVINAHIDPNWPSDYRDDILDDLRSRIQSGD